MDDDQLADDFHRLVNAFGLKKVRLKKMNAIGAAERGDSQTHLDVHNLSAAALQAIHELYPHDFTIGGYTKRTAEG